RPPSSTLFPYTTLFRSTQADVGQSGFWLDYTSMHDSDTASNCLGLQANFASVEAMTYDLRPFTWQSVPPDALTPTNNQNNNSERSEEHTSELQLRENLV